MNPDSRFPVWQEIVHVCRQSGARTGILHTPHGTCPTPAFMPVGTQATVKSMSSDELRQLGAGVILANTYHLWLRPGSDLIREAGGLHRFMNWDRALLTDSGGFQVFSLADRRKISEEGVAFRSHIDGSARMLTPEQSIAIQNDLGADITMAFDECVPYPCDPEYAGRSLERTVRWLERCLQAHRQTERQALFGIVQGGVDARLRVRSADLTTAFDLAGYAVGGLSVGEPPAEMYAMLDVTVPRLPADRPRYLMGVGSPDHLIEGSIRGIDLFDCVLPTRNARNGTVLTRDGRIIIRDARYARDFQPIEENCPCPTCRQYTRAYLRHLFKAGEILAMRLATWHNLQFMFDLMADIRTAIREDRLLDFRDAFFRRFGYREA